MATLVAIAACDVQSSVEPTLDPSVEVSGAKSQRADCRVEQLSSTTTATLEEGCAFDTGSGIRYEDLYLVNQKRLGMSDLSGASMLTFTGAADFDAIFGLGRQGPDLFSDPVYGFTRFAGGATDTFGNAFSFVGSKNVYKFWFGGQTSDQLGEYSLTTSIEPTVDTCENGHWVFIQGDARFSSDISDATSCQGTVEFGPNVGLPLNYQFWYYRIQAGETVNVELSGLSDDPSLTLAAIDLGTGESVLDFSEGPGDTTRSVSFTASRDFYLYLEVSSSPGVVSDYTLVVDGP